MFARQYLYTIIGLSCLLFIVACSSSDPALVAPERAVQEAEDVMIEAAVPEEVAADMEVVAPEETVKESVAEAKTEESSPSDEAEISVNNLGTAPNPYNRKIIKDAQLDLLVENSDAALNRTLSIVNQFQGYIISNQTRFEGEFKYASLTIGVPVDNFELMLTQLKKMALQVTNETASGQDVTDQYVDLQSRLRNLEATEARIRDFLDQADSVEESLQVNGKLSEIESEIEQVKGRMNALKDRATFSTITINISPQLPTPTPLPTATPTATPKPTATPDLWTVNDSIDRASGVSASMAQGLFRISVELLVWFVFLVLPFGLPLLVISWFAYWLTGRLGLRQTASW